MVVAIAMSMSAFWTGSRFVSIGTVPVAVLVFGMLQMPWWRKLRQQQQQQQQQQAVVEEGALEPSWYDKSIKPVFFFVGLTLCALSFVVTDWMTFQSTPVWLRSLRALVLLYVPAS